MLHRILLLAGLMAGVALVLVANGGGAASTSKVTISTVNESVTIHPGDHIFVPITLDNSQGDYSQGILLSAIFQTNSSWNYRFIANETGAPLPPVKDTNNNTIEPAVEVAKGATTTIYFRLTAPGSKYTLEPQIISILGYDNWGNLSEGTNITTRLDGEILNLTVTMAQPDIMITNISLRETVMAGSTLKVVVNVENNGSQARNIRVYFYYGNPAGELLPGGTSPWPLTRMTRFGAATVALLESKAVLEAGGNKTYTTVTATWKASEGGYGPQLPAGATGDYSDVQIFVWANPSNAELTASDRAAGYNHYIESDENLSNNFAESSVIVVRGGYVVDFYNPENIVINLLLTEKKLLETFDSHVKLEVNITKFNSVTYYITIEAIEPTIFVYYADCVLINSNNTIVTNGSLSQIYGYKLGQGKGIVFSDNDYNGWISAGDRFIIHAGEEGDPHLNEISNLSGYTLRLTATVGLPEEDFNWFEILPIVLSAIILAVVILKLYKRNESSRP